MFFKKFVMIASSRNVSSTSKILLMNSSWEAFSDPKKMASRKRNNYEIYIGKGLNTVLHGSSDISFYFIYEDTYASIFLRNVTQENLHLNSLINFSA